MRSRREALALTQEALAFKAGVSLKTIERIERGQVIPRRATVKVIADALEMDVAELTVGEAA